MTTCERCGSDAGEWEPLLLLAPASDPTRTAAVMADPPRRFCTPCRASLAMVDVFDARWIDTWHVELGRRACCDEHRPSRRNARIRWRRHVRATGAPPPE